jgi:hypothetical protein
VEYTNITPTFGVELPAGAQFVDFTNYEVTALKQLAAERVLSSPETSKWI